MSTGEGGGDARDGRADGRNGPGERISIGGGDDSVTRIQLAARWAEAYAPETDSLGHVLRRFRAAYDYLDAVIHGVEPPDLDREVTESSAGRVVEPTSAPTYSTPAAPPTPPEASPPPPPPWA